MKNGNDAQTWINFKGYIKKDNNKKDSLLKELDGKRRELKETKKRFGSRE